MINTTIGINAPLSKVRSVVHAPHPPFVRISTPHKPSSSTSLPSAPAAAASSKPSLRSPPPTRHPPPSIRETNSTLRSGRLSSAPSRKTRPAAADGKACPTEDYSYAGRWVLYGQSKLANVVYAPELSRHYPNSTTVSVHPGVIFTNLWSVQWSLLNRIFVYLATLGQAVLVEEGAHNPCWAMTTPKEMLSPGAFHKKVGVIGSPSKDSQSKELGEELWTWTQSELDGYRI